jgi:hypothetical protein
VSVQDVVVKLWRRHQNDGVEARLNSTDPAPRCQKRPLARPYGRGTNVALTGAYSESEGQ